MAVNWETVMVQKQIHESYSSPAFICGTDIDFARVMSPGEEIRNNCLWNAEKLIYGNLFRVRGRLEGHANYAGYQ